jgi:multidrug efflux pump subunit AcrA (membrane-fusion protein)
VASHPGQSFAGRVAWVNPAIDPASRAFQVEVAVPNDQRLLRPGGFAKAAIVTRDKTQRTVVPIEAIVRYAGVTKVFIVRAGKAVDVPIGTGIEGAGWVEVTGELEPGAQVIVSGQSQLADCAEILVRDESKAAETAERTASREN